LERRRCQHRAVGNPNPPRVLVVDDHRAFAEALAIAVGQDLGLRVEVATSSAEAIEATGRLAPDIVLMDLEMPGVGGIPTTRHVLSIHPQARVIVVSAHEDDVLRARAVEAGAIGFVSKLNPLSTVCQAVRMALNGEPMFDREELARLSRLLRHRRHQEATQRMRVGRLTPRHVEILQMMADGVSPKEIAERLGVSPLTLRTHVQNILTRLGAHTKLEAVALAIKHGRVAVSTTTSQLAIDVDV
jgi:DNA-binding NarL/FixJ family response regulator